MASEYATADAPEPNAVPPDAGTLVPKVSLQVPGLVVLYLYQPVAAELFGLAVPFKVAVVVVTKVAALVTTVGIGAELTVTVTLCSTAVALPLSTITFPVYVPFGVYICEGTA